MTVYFVCTILVVRILFLEALMEKYRQTLSSFAVLIRHIGVAAFLLVAVCRAGRIRVGERLPRGPIWAPLGVGRLAIAADKTP